jgi:hypothetical protein
VIYLWAKRMQRRWGGLTREQQCAALFTLYFAPLVRRRDARVGGGRRAAGDPPVTRRFRGSRLEAFITLAACAFVAGALVLLSYL